MKMKTTLGCKTKKEMWVIRAWHEIPGQDDRFYRSEKINAVIVWSQMNVRLHDIFENKGEIEREFHAGN